MKKFFPIVIVALIVILSANCSAGVYDEPIGENVRVSDIGAERFLAAMKDTEIFRNRMQLNFNPLTRAQSFDKPNNGLTAWTSLFYDDQNIGGTLIFYVNGDLWYLNLWLSQQ